MKSALDLIETLRNVKYVLNDLHYSHYIKFNRDIVECKEEHVVHTCHLTGI